MDIQKEYYGDHLEQIHFSGGLIRCDFVTIQPNPNNPDMVGTEKTFRLVMNMQGFLTTFDTMKKLADRMVEAGILKRNIDLKEKLDD